MYTKKTRSSWRYPSIATSLARDDPVNTYVILAAFRCIGNLYRESTAASMMNALGARVSTCRWPLSKNEKKKSMVPVHAPQDRSGKSLPFFSFFVHDETLQFFCRNSADVLQLFWWNSADILQAFCILRLYTGCADFLLKECATWLPGGHGKDRMSVTCLYEFCIPCDWWSAEFMQKGCDFLFWVLTFLSFTFFSSSHFPLRKVSGHAAFIRIQLLISWLT